MDCVKRGLRNKVVLVSMLLNSEKLVLVCGRAVISRSERNVGAQVDKKWRCTYKLTSIDVQYSQHIMKTSMTEAISLTVILYCNSYYYAYIIG